MYTLAFYFGAIPSGHMDQWNVLVPGLYDKHNLAALLAIGAHFAMGGAILMLGPVQFIGGLRERWPWIHRWLGRLYVFTAALAGLGGLGFIASKGTIGGAWMNIGFGLYGALIVLAAMKTYRNARARRWEQHRAWAIRSVRAGDRFLALSAGLRLLALPRRARSDWPSGELSRPVRHRDVVLLYLPNLAIAELYLRAGRCCRIECCASRPWSF